MNKKQEKELEKSLTKWINADRIISVANGYCCALQEIKNMIKNGKTKKELEEYCDLHLNNKDKIIKVKEESKNGKISREKC